MEGNIIEEFISFCTINNINNTKKLRIIYNYLDKVLVDDIESSIEESNIESDTESSIEESNIESDTESSIEESDIESNIESSIEESTDIESDIEELDVKIQNFKLQNNVEYNNKIKEYIKTLNLY